MRKIRDVLRLKSELGRSHREIILRISLGSYLRQAREAGVLLIPVHVGQRFRFKPITDCEAF